MKKATPGNKYVLLKFKQISHTNYSKRQQKEWAKYKKFLATLPKDEAEKRALRFWSKRTVIYFQTIWINQKYNKKIKRHIEDGWTVELTGWANKHGVIVIDI